MHPLLAPKFPVKSVHITSNIAAHFLRVSLMNTLNTLSTSLTTIMTKHTTACLAATLIAVSSLASVSSFALPSDRQQAITLEADRATYNEKSGITTYTGNVIIQQGTVKIQADSLVATLNKDRQIQQVTAKGRPAKFQQQISIEKGLARGEGQSMVYNAETGVIVMTGNAYLTQDGASFRGNILRYSITAGDVEATGNAQRRIQIIIPPSSTQTNSKARTK